MRRHAARGADPEVARLEKAIQTTRSDQGERALTKGADGVWTLTLPPVESDVYEYHFVIDGTGVLDPRNPVVKYNSRPNLVESLLEVPGDGPMFYDVKQVPHGTVGIRLYPSKATGSTRRAYVTRRRITSAAARSCRCCISCTALTATRPCGRNSAGPNQILDNLIAEKKASPMVIVMPFGYAYPWYSRRRGRQAARGFRKRFARRSHPVRQANYRVFTDRDHRALAGLSMGGGQTISIGPRHLDLFSRLAVFSASAGADPRPRCSRLRPNGQRAAEAVLARHRHRRSRITPMPRRPTDYLTSVGIKHTFKTTILARTRGSSGGDS